MGVAIGDYDNDGRDDIHITNFADDFNVLYRNEDGAQLRRRELQDRHRARVAPVSRLGHELSRLRQRRLARPAGRQRPRLPGRSTRFLEHDLRAARAAAAQPRRPRASRTSAPPRVRLTVASRLPRLGRRRHRRRRRGGHRREQHRRRADAGGQRRRRGGHWLTLVLRGDPAQRVSAGRNRVRRVRHRRGTPRAGRGRQRPRPGLAIRPARARGAR